MAQYKGAAQEAQRAMNILRRRQREREEIELRRKKIEEDNNVGNIIDKFASHYDAIEQRLKTNTVGLVTLDEMRRKQECAVKEREAQLAQAAADARLAEEKAQEEKAIKKRKREENKSKLSFDVCEGDDDDDDEDEDDIENEEDDFKEEDIDEELMDSSEAAKRKRFGKDPTVDTSFLPDRDREEEENKLRAQLREEWEDKQRTIKSELLNITYSYWDGSGHRREITVRKGVRIHDFLQKCLAVLKLEFNELKAASVDQLMYIKEDTIIPQHYTFYDLIVTKARGKSGPLFCFDVHDDVRLVHDAKVEKDESHAGKVCLRSWYERNKHIFPASRWEPYDPEKKVEKYTISDKLQ